jgi:N-acetyl-anhydromuramyl-L-alanine amidase AmpD
MRQINLIVIHCSASPDRDSLFRNALGHPEFRTPVDVIDGWHRERGFRRDAEAVKRFNSRLTSIGYHYVIYRNGAIATGRSEDEVGAHVKRYNRGSLGVCLVGTSEFTPEQWFALKELIDALHKKYPNAIVLGHRDLSPDRDGNGEIDPGEWTKTCPGFDVALWIARRMEPPRGALP